MNFKLKNTITVSFIMLITIFGFSFVGSKGENVAFASEDIRNELKGLDPIEHLKNQNGDPNEKYKMLFDLKKDLDYMDLTDQDRILLTIKIDEMILEWENCSRLA